MKYENFGDRPKAIRGKAISPTEDVAMDHLLRLAKEIGTVVRQDQNRSTV